MAGITRLLGTWLGRFGLGAGLSLVCSLLPLLFSRALRLGLPPLGILPLSTLLLPRCLSLGGVLLTLA